MGVRRRTITLPEDLDDSLIEESVAQDRTVSSLLTTYGREGLERDPRRRTRKPAKVSKDRR